MTNPSVTLTTPWKDPANTYRATKTIQMYTFAQSVPSWDIVYNIGQPPSMSVQKIALRNNTVNIDLKFDIKLPAYLTSSVSLSFLVHQNSVTWVTFPFIEAEAKKRSVLPNKTFIDKISIVVTPSLITGPVYVLSNLQELTV